MISILKRYYGIDVDYYKKYNEGIIFFVNGDYYYFFYTPLSEEEINESDFSDLLRKNGILVHDFVLNNNGGILSENYILIKLNHLIDEISLSEITKFNINVMSKANIGFYDKWIDRVDYLEKQLTELSGNKLINNSFDYFVGIAEQLLDFLKVNYNDIGDTFITHRTFANLSTIDFYNPINIVLGNRYKDIASFIQLNNDWDLLDIVLDKINDNDRVYLFVKLVFPFDYFYAINLYVTGDVSRLKNINYYIDHIEEYENYLIKVSNLFGYNLFYWIKKDN